MEKHNTQHGGNYLLDNHVSANVEAIVSGNYKLLSEMKNVETMNIQLDKCLDINSLFEKSNINGYNYKPGKALKCFIRNPMITSSSLEKDDEYMFKKQFSLDITDMFMQKNMTEKDLGIATNYIYYVFDYALTKLLETLIKNYTFGFKTQHLINKVYLLYKGGNTTRLLLRNFARDVTEIIDRNMGLVKEDKISAVTDAKTKLDELVNGFNIGDWDYMMKIEFDELVDLGFTVDELEKLVMYLMQVFYSTATYVKEKISELLKSKKNIDTMSTAMQNYMLDNNTKERIQNFVTKYNLFTKTGEEKIESMTLKKISMYDNVITEDEIRKMTQNEMLDLYKSSFLFRTSGKIAKHKNQNVTYNEHFEIDTPFIDENNNEIPDYLTNNVVYAAYLSRMGFCRRYALSDFNLIRLKVSNIIDMDIKFAKNDAPLEKKMFVNAELVDISVSNVNDCKGIYNKHYYYPGYKDLTTAVISKDDFKTEKTTVIIPSVHMMFADICHMLFTENLFVWEDPKYAKRIKRLFFLSLPCMYNDGMRTKTILHNFQETRILFDRLNKFGNNIDAKLNYLAGHYEIIVSPYNTIINEKMKKNVTDTFMKLGTVHLIVKIKTGSPYKFKYLEFLLANYIKMLILAKYIIFNTVSNEHADLVLYELQIHRIFELKNISSYLNPNMTTLTPSLTKIYLAVRGTTHTYKDVQLLKRGPMNGLIAALPTAVDKFFDPRLLDPKNDKALLPYEETIINNSKYIENVLEGMLQAHIGKMHGRYISESLF